MQSAPSACACKSALSREIFLILPRHLELEITAENSDPGCTDTVAQPGSGAGARHACFGLAQPCSRGVDMLLRLAGRAMQDALPVPPKALSLVTLRTHFLCWLLPVQVRSLESRQPGVCTVQGCSS